MVQTLPNSVYSHPQCLQMTEKFKNPYNQENKKGALCRAEIPRSPREMGRGKDYCSGLREETTAKSTEAETSGRWWWLRGSN